MPLIIVDCEADGPMPVRYSLVCFGAVVVESALDRTFYGRCAPISEKWDAQALAVSGISREEHEVFPDPAQTMREFADWLGTLKGGQLVFVSDNPAFDWQWINFYFHEYIGRNPFGFSARRIGDFAAGLENDWFMASKWKSLRQTRHTHNPVDDARGNAEALLSLLERSHRQKAK
ncbi:exonuclease [bacterium]|nr:MAG: exonuclease [bacterium]